MAKTNPIGVRFDPELLEKLKESGVADSPQKALNVYERTYVEYMAAKKEGLRFAAPTPKKAVEPLDAEITYAKITPESYDGKKIEGRYLMDEVGLTVPKAVKTVAEQIKDLEDEIIRVGPAATLTIAYNTKKIKELKKKL